MEDDLARTTSPQSAAAKSQIIMSDVLHSDDVAEPYSNNNNDNNLQEPLIHKLQQLSVSDGGSTTAETESRQSPPPPYSPTSFVRKRNSSPGTPAPRLQRISTPMEGNSPSTSQVSTGSVPPNIIAGLLADLTPVTRNTSSTAVPTQYGNKTARISPEDSLLLGEDLVLPSHDDWYPKIRPNGGIVAASMKARSQEEDVPMLPPVPMERKFYSFTSRQQYEEAMVDDTPVPPPPRLTPYQPNRELLGDLGLQEDLDDIFIERRRYSSSAHDVDASKQHRLLNAPIPMNERQISIPSIRMANHLNGSVTSREDDEDSLYIHDEEASLSSRGSCGGVVCFAEDVVVDIPSNRHVIMVDRRKRGRKEGALEWLQSVVEVSDNTLAEAASSKFLTRHDYHQPPLHRSQTNNISVPSNLSLPRRDSSPPGFLATVPR